MRVKIKIPRIPEEKKTLIVSQLLEIIEQLSVINQQQKELIQQLKDENARLKKKKPRCWRKALKGTVQKASNGKL